MTSLIKIGNSQGIRIPKTIIKQAHLENANLELEVLENGLLIKPMQENGRENWAENIQSILTINKKSDDGLLDEMLNDSDLDENEW
jgi:antitoxin MazE